MNPQPRKVGMKTIAAGIAGFGLSGKVFHAPFLDAHPGFRLKAFATTGDEAARLYPDSVICRNFNDLIHDKDIRLIVICTPHLLHVSQAIEAMEAGKDVIIEKPVAMSSRDVKTLIRMAEASGKRWFPYHNRRWDGDFLTVRQLIKEKTLGNITDFESHFDRYTPEIGRAAWRYNDASGGGTLFDLGPHLIDQTVALFGKPDSVWCKLYTRRRESKASDSFDLKLFYPETTATLKAGVFMAEPGPRFQVHGTLGSYIKYGVDPQEARLRNGAKAGSPAIGKERVSDYGILATYSRGELNRRRYPTLNGNYMGFYDNVYKVLTRGGKPEINADDALLNLLIIEAAIRSDAEGKIIPIV